ncbi:MAG TPA: SpoIID/LytB domain-containing protein [Bacteroidia bacterium]|nr:SpoIID/LytB domain-containing protein [Bacteroidia bacterium]HRH07523.1 SpoIID/LytB domain-containing protein [Bacteroidia bacterium]
MLNKLLAFFLLLPLYTCAITINIGVYTNLQITSILVTQQSGNYYLLFDNSIRREIDIEAVYFIFSVDDSIIVKSNQQLLGKFKRIEFKEIVPSVLKMRCILPSTSSKQFDNNLVLFSEKGSLKVRNEVELENYVAGVVEMEAGSNHTIEYYKVQAIICRTYALSNLRRHEVEQYNLCDNVHCQAYKGNNRINEQIAEATIQTKNLVMVDKKSELITTAFHSNCGGQTCNSEDVWGMSKPYLRSVRDTFCLRQRNATWVKSVPKATWAEYLYQNCKPCANDTSLLCCDFDQTERKTSLNYSSVQLPLKNIRNDLKLKSSFFAIQIQPDSVLFVGKGYGHGVGLCQEGAIQMARAGLKYNYILHYYYKDVDIINLNQLNFFKD